MVFDDDEQTKKGGVESKTKITNEHNMSNTNNNNNNNDHNGNKWKIGIKLMLGQEQQLRLGRNKYLIFNFD